MSNISKAFLLRKYKQRRSQIELVNYIVLLVVVSLALVGVQGLSQLKTYAEEIPTEDKIRANLVNKGENSKIYDRNGVHLYTFKDPDRDREYAGFNEIPPTVIAAALAAEDKDFFIHEGIDYLGTAKGIATTLATGGESKIGGSTITQQLIKQTLLSNERTVDRKIKEAIIALRVEQNYTKEEILEYYLNVSNYGGRVQGIKTASYTYFNKPVTELNLNEAALLMSLVQSPGEYSPLFANNKEQAAKLANERRIFILEQIAKNPQLLGYLNSADRNLLYLHSKTAFDPTGGVSEPQYTAASVASLQVEVFSFSLPVDELRAPHWVFYIRDLLQQEPYNLSIIDLYSGGYKIYTSLDIRIQELAEQKIKEGVDIYGSRYNFQNAALVSVDPRNGEILAMVGSKGYNLPNEPGNKRFDSEVNVTTARQSLGSSLKPWVAYLAIKSGKYNRNTIVEDTPQTFYRSYKPKNSDGKFMGEMTLHKALLESRNLPFLKISYQMGDWQLPELMKQVGYRTDAKYGLAATVGGVDETLLDHTVAYTGFANGGKVMKKKPVLRIERGDGSVSYKAKEGDVLYELNRPAVAAVNDILGDKSYTPGPYGYKFPGGGYKLAGKTGTSDSNKDTYYIGYGPRIVSGVWCGNNDNSRMTNGAFGSYTALPIWSRQMGEFLRQFPEYAERGSY